MGTNADLPARLSSRASGELHPTIPVVRRADPWLGRRLGKYCLQARLGQGGMGVVYQAHDSTLDRPVAVKLLADALAGDPSFVQRFQREARSAARLNHPNIVTVHTIEQSDEVVFLVMELVAGCSGQQLLDSRGALPWRAATQVLADACQGLAAAHEAGLVHRDLKPGNLLISQRGEVKVADFGLARARDGHSSSLTAPGTVVGTPSYMSPEQALAEQVDERSDLYSLGVTYFALLTGQPPFPDGTPAALLHAHRTRPVPDPRAARPDLPAACTAIVQKALAKTPAQRYPSAPALLEDLQKLLGHRREDLRPLFKDVEPTDRRRPATPRTGWRGPPRQTTRRRLLLLAPLLMSAFALAALGWYLLRPEAPPETGPALAARVAGEMRELNPGFDGRLNERLDADGEVDQVGLDLSHVTNLAPLRRLPRLHTVVGKGKGYTEPGPLTDLRPLAGTKITRLTINFCKLESLDGVQRLPLTELDLIGTRVKDLTPLKGVPLVRLDVTGTSVEDLAGLEDMLTLKDLHAATYGLTSLKPLSKLSLTSLSLTGSRVRSLDPLKGMPLVHLDVSDTRVDNMDALRDMPLQRFLFAGRGVKFQSYEPLRTLKDLQEITAFREYVPLLPALDRPVVVNHEFVYPKKGP